MKYLLCIVLVAAYSSGFASEPPCKMTLEQAREKLPQFKHLDDESFVEVVHRRYYSDVPKAEFDAYLCYQAPAAPEPRTLNAFDRWRYNSCQKDAAQAPTPQGVNIGMRLCREKFGQ